MQIKKGPYGYYAIEKFDSPDKLCSYADSNNFNLYSKG